MMECDEYRRSGPKRVAFGFLSSCTWCPSVCAVTDFVLLGQTPRQWAGDDRVRISRTPRNSVLFNSKILTLDHRNHSNDEPLEDCWYHH